MGRAMRCALAVTLLFPVLAAQSPQAAPKTAQGQAETPAPIRAFDLATLEKLGKQLYEHDQWAWKATDLLLEKVGMEKLTDGNGRGWIVDDEGSVPKVLFLRQGKERLEIAWEIRFPADGKPTLEIPKEQGLSVTQQARHAARLTAINHLTEGKYPICPLPPGGGSYNFALLKDPEGKGFLFYFLRPKTTVEEIPVGGHYRLTVSADGQRVERLDRLFQSCLMLSRPAAAEQAQGASLFVTHVVSPTPTEIHVFLSLQESLPLFVGTLDRKLWKVEGARIQFVQMLEEEKEKATPSH